MKIEISLTISSLGYLVMNCHPYKSIIQYLSILQILHLVTNYLVILHLVTPLLLQMREIVKEIGKL